MKRRRGCCKIMESHKASIAMLLVQFAYAGMALFSKAAVAKGMNPFVFVVYRQAFATIALAPFTLFLERKITAPLSYILILRIFLVSLCGITLSLNLYYVAIQYTTATLAAATTNTIPAITFVMAVLLRMETLSVKHVPGIAKIVGSIMGLSGALLFAFVKGPPVSFMNWKPTILQESSTNGGGFSREWITGSLIMISANTSWSFWLVMQGPIVEQYPSKLRLTTLQCFFGCIQSALFAIAVVRNPSDWKLGWDANLLSVAYCGIIVTGMTYWLQVWTIEKKGPVYAALFTPLALVITVVFSVCLRKETLHWGSIGGDAVLVGGLYSVLWGKSKEEAKSATVDQKLESKEQVIRLECITHQ